MFQQKGRTRQSIIGINFQKEGAFLLEFNFVVLMDPFLLAYGELLFFLDFFLRKRNMDWLYEFFL